MDVVLFATDFDSREVGLQRRIEMFASSKGEARRCGARWFALSSRFGLVDETEASLASIDMDPIPDHFGDDWSSWIALRLESNFEAFEGVTIFIDAPSQYRDLLAPKLLSRGAQLLG